MNEWTRRTGDPIINHIRRWFIHFLDDGGISLSIDGDYLLKQTLHATNPTNIEITRGSIKNR